MNNENEKPIDTARFDKEQQYPLGTVHIDSCGRKWRYFKKVKPPERTDDGLV